MDKREQFFRKCARIAIKVSDLLAPQTPEVVAEVISEAMARLIACNHPDIRAEVRADLIAAADAMVPKIVDAMIKHGTASEDWRAATLQ